MAGLTSKQTIVVMISLLGAIALGQATVGWISLGQVAQKVNYLAANSLPTMLKIGDIRASAMEAQMLIAEEIIPVSDAERQVTASTLQQVEASTAQLLEDYKPMIVDQGDQDAYDGVVAAWGAWVQAAQQVEAALASAPETATAKYHEQETAGDAFSKALKAMSDDKVVNSNDESAAAAASVASAQLWAITLSIAVLLAGIAAIAVAIRRVLNPLGAMTARMNTLAEGHLDEAIPYTSRGDEIGEMAAAVKVFQVNAIKVRELNDAEAIRTGQTRERAASMTQLMDGLATAVNAAVDGDFTQRIALSVPDEDLQAVAKNVNDLLSTVDAGISETGEVLAALAQTDLTMRMQGEYRGAFAKLKADTNAVVDNLSDVVGQLRHTSGGLKTATGEILAGANDLAERTTKQAAAIEETSAAMEQLSTTVIENAKRAEQASSKAQNVSDTAALTGEVMTKSNAAMERISSSSAKISNIIGLIDDIAFQTNLLALNASVEAARAGDAGKGFAVVAVEVRRLAQSAASASSEVKVLIEQSAGEVSSGSKLVAEATQKLIDMLGSVKESAELIKDISSASREQSNAIAEVSGAIRQMDEMTQHNAALVEETNAAIEQTESQANELDTIVDRFVVDQHTSRTATPAPAARPAAAPPATGIKALQQKVKAAANSYLSKGNAALKEDWNEF
ncbi:HAMP domain-containing methyl-accepting chemotaxis protein [Devosia sp.]|uniref:HAMP domain-containing methyl-accepting chemotaxis protein n=1 Tax=Devosia sp. TaxID=1871048 RepID=UPI003BA895A3